MKEFEETEAPIPQPQADVVLPDGSVASTMSLPLPHDHWLYRKRANVPPMPLRTGTWQTLRVHLRDQGGLQEVARGEVAKLIARAARYAYRASTINGTASSVDPDAFVQNLTVGLLGYFTADGLSPEAVENPGPEGDAARLALAKNHNDPKFLADCLEFEDRPLSGGRFLSEP